MILPVLCLASLLGPDAPPDLVSDDVHECMAPDHPDAWSDVPETPLTSIDCGEHKDTGYVKGDPFEITVVTVDGLPVEVQTANAYYQMAQAAAADGVGMKINSGFRTMAEQEYFYGCYVNCNCNSCNEAAKPGYSNHQSGHALDINTASSGVYGWLAAHGGDYGFTRTVASEDWHWEWWGGGPPASGPCGVPDFAGKFAAQSFAPSSQAPIILEVGDSLDVWVDLENVGKATWTANTWIAPTPRDVASPLADPSWLSPTRIATPQADTPPGAVGRFAFNIGATTPGDYYQTFGVVEEGVTWFSDKPKGGGPSDSQIEIHVVVIADPGSPTPAPTGETTGSDDGTGDADGGSGEPPAPTTGDAPGSTSAGESGSDPDPNDADDSDENAGCGCDTRAPIGSNLGWLALLAPLALPRARKRRVSAP